MALRQETVRLLIADDVGIGKTVEAGLVASELLAQGSARGLAVLCPPSLAEQWHAELREKFGLDAALVLAGTVRRLERGLGFGESVFDRHPITVISTDFIKADNRRDDFLRAAPDLVIVDEAHGCVTDDTNSGSRGRTQRYRLVRDLAKQPDRHLLLVTATPHSGNEGAFRSMLGLLDPAFRDADLQAEDNRARLARHMVQRRRADIRTYLAEDTQFPSDRQTLEVGYRLSPAYRDLFDDVIAYARGQVQDRSGTVLQQRVRWWAALSLLRALASSPAAAAATLETRAASAVATSARQADEMGRASVLDQYEDEALDGADAVPGAVIDDPDGRPDRRRRRAPSAAARRERRLLLQFRDAAQALTAADDAKLLELTRRVRRLLADGFHPIVFCRFLHTAHYVGTHLRDALPKGAVVEIVTGELPPEERSARVRALADADAPKGRVLVATDCLSEGVNLQRDFQAVVHYDLAWNPTRHEQREGRVDRFGQPADVVRALTVYGEDNGVDGVVMEVLLRKHEQIRKDLGISVPVPNDTNDRVLAALMEGLLLRGKEGEQLTLDLDARRDIETLDDEWDSMAEREKASRTRYAQHALHPDEVAREVNASRDALGSPTDIASLVHTALLECGAHVTPASDGFTALTDTLPVGLRDAMAPLPAEVRFHTDLPAPRDAVVLTRTDPRVGAVGRYVLDAALDTSRPPEQRPARRAGVITTTAVQQVTTLLLVRFRVRLTLPTRTGPRVEVAEEARLLAFTGPPTDPTWLDPDQVTALLGATATAVTPPGVAGNLLAVVLDSLPALTTTLEDEAGRVAEALREAHVRVRRAARGAETAGGLGVRGLAVEPQLPVDILGVYAYRPDGATR